jgi:hypothetical protein
MVSFDRITEDLRNRAKILVDTPTNMSDIMPQALPANYQTITPLSPRAGVTVRRFRPLTHYVSGWYVDSSAVTNVLSDNLLAIDLATEYCR